MTPKKVNRYGFQEVETLTRKSIRIGTGELKTAMSQQNPPQSSKANKNILGLQRAIFLFVIYLSSRNCSHH
jgi:hypothetical protein